MTGAGPSDELRPLRGRLVAWAAADEFVPLYAVYALLFEDGGLTAASISIGLVAWSASVVLLEVPSGALADRVDRRALLVASTLVRAVGFTLWLAADGLPAVVTGFVLWGASGALNSGTWQALAWDELARIGPPTSTPLWPHGCSGPAALRSACPSSRPLPWSPRS